MRRASGHANGRSRHRRGIAAAALGLVASATAGLDASAASPPSIFVVAKYPVQAQAGDAVTAKAQALADGQQGAFRSLLKRLVPVTAYKRLPRLPLARVQDMIAGFSVRSERNSSTEYLGSYDFEFQAKAVRELLRSSGIPEIEETAPPAVIVPAYGVPSSQPAATSAKGGKAQPAAGAALPAHFQPDRVAPAWAKSWADLDTEHALTPVRIAKGTESVTEDAVRAVANGDGGALRALAGAELNDRVVLAYATPTADARKLSVTLAGRDAVGWFTVTRSYPILDGDIAYATELAAVVGLGIVEGRWKALKSARSGTGSIAADGVEGWSTTSDKPDRDDGVSVSPPAAGGWTDDIELVVEFRGLGQWQQIRQRLRETPGVEDLEVGQMSARTALVKLRYPGGAQRLANDLGAQGMSLDNQGGNWVLQVR